MAMFRCEECGHLFEDGEQKVWYEHHPYGMGTASEEFSGCPLCEGNYEKIEPCKICGSYEHDIEEEYCDDCVKEFKDNLKFVLAQNFNEKQIELFKELYGDV